MTMDNALVDTGVGSNIFISMRIAKKAIKYLRIPWDIKFVLCGVGGFDGKPL